MYSFESRVRYSEVGENKRLTLDAIINYFQDCSTFQSEELGNGIAVMEDLHRVWVLSSWQIVVNEYPMLGERIVTSTWPYEFRRFLGSRNFVMTGADGRMLAYANSLWTYLDSESGRPVRVEPEVEKAYVLEPRLSMDYAERKLAVPEDGERQEPFHISVHHLDTNHHVNNGQYVRMAADYLPQGFVISQLRAEYKKSALLDDVIYPVVSRVERGIVVSLLAEDEHPYAIIEFLD